MTAVQEKLDRVTTTLIERSIQSFSNPYVMFDWPAQLPADRLAMSEAFLPLAGHPLFKELNDEQRWRIALMETVNFFSINIAGERELMSGLALRLHCGRPTSLSRYLQLFLHEENAHTVVFARFCLDYGGVIYPDRQLRFPRQFRAGEEEFLFFTRVLIFEEIAHFYNRRISLDDGVCAIARDIHRYHAEEETRHIAFGRVLVQELWERFGSQWTAEDRKSIGDYLARYITSVLRSYVNPSVYSALGVVPHTLRDEILASPHWTRLAAASSSGITTWLTRMGVLNAQ